MQLESTSSFVSYVCVRKALLAEPTAGVTASSLCVRLVDHETLLFDEEFTQHSFASIASSQQANGKLRIATKRVHPIRGIQYLRGNVTARKEKGTVVALAISHIPTRQIFAASTADAWSLPETCSQRNA